MVGLGRWGKSLMAAAAKSSRIAFPQAVADARAMIDACKQADVRLALGQNRRFWPAMVALRKLVGDGRLGRVLHVEGHNSNENSNRVTGGWRTLERESPGGGFTGAGLHAVRVL